MTRLSSGPGLLLFAGFLVTGSIARAQGPTPGLPTGYFIDTVQAATPRPAWDEETDGEFTYSIRRGWPDSTGERLLRVAESVYPPRDIPVRIASRNGYELGGDSAHISLWWFKGIDAARVPYAVTAGALEHYLSLTRLYRERRFREAGTRPLFRSKLVYRATIAERDTFRIGSDSFRDVWVATLTLLWTYDDGTFLPSVGAHRVVVIARDGTPLAEEGDGLAEEKVSTSTHRGVGREERILK
jgi:hypothetical protein